MIAVETIATGILRKAKNKTSRENRRNNVSADLSVVEPSSLSKKVQEYIIRPTNISNGHFMPV